MHTVLEILNLSTTFLQQKGIQQPRRQAEELLGDALGVGRVGLYMEFDRPLNEAELEKCRSWLKRRALGEPLPYISGKVDFFDCEILVNSDVLIPRQETEILVDKIAKTLSKEKLEGKVLWDVCCGAGCIGISLKKRFPELQVVLSDISPKAIVQAKLNATHNSVEIEFLMGDLLAPFAQKKCDFFVCNPPYISTKEIPSLDHEVINFEPKLSLISGETGLEFYERLAVELPQYLNADGKAWFELGTGQGNAIKEMFTSPKWKRVEVESDWSGHDRFFSLEFE